MCDPLAPPNHHVCPSKEKHQSKNQRKKQFHCNHANLVKVVLTFAQLVHAGNCMGDFYRDDGQNGMLSYVSDPYISGLYTPGGSAKCKQVAAALNKEIADSSNPIDCNGGYDKDFLHVTAGFDKCDEVATKLSQLIEGVRITCSNCEPDIGDDAYAYASSQYPCYTSLHVSSSGSSDMMGARAEATMKLSMFLGDIVETLSFKPFYYAALPITGATFIASGGYAYRYLAGDSDTNWFATLLFATFVALRVFDLMSDWGMYAISLGTQHAGLPLRHASLAFSIIGSLLMIVDLSTMHKRAKHWFGIEDGSESLKSVGYGMLTVVILEDIPQLIISAIFFSEIYGNDGGAIDRKLDPVAITSMVLSTISLISNGFIAIRSLY